MPLALLAALLGLLGSLVVAEVLLGLSPLWAGPPSRN